MAKPLVTLERCIDRNNALDMSGRCFLSRRLAQTDCKVYKIVTNKQVINTRATAVFTHKHLFKTELFHLQNKVASV